MILFIFVFIAVEATVCMADAITIGADEWFPYNGPPESSLPGYGVEITRVIFEEKGHTIDYKTTNWIRAVKMTLAGQFNCVIGATSGDIPQAIFPEEPIGISLNAFFVKKGSKWKYESVDSLKLFLLELLKTTLMEKKQMPTFKQFPTHYKYKW